MLYRLPEITDQGILDDYVQEHLANDESDIGAGYGLPAQSYADWVQSIRKNADEGDPLWGKSILYLCFDEERLIGLLCIRYELPQDLSEKYGNIGYGVRPSERRKGYATTMLAHALSVCKAKGLKKVTLGCYKENHASVATILKNGGVLISETSDTNQGKNVQYFEIPL